MKIRNRHERILAAPPGQIAALIADFGRVWPTQIAPAPRRHGARLYDAGLMFWEEFDRPGAARAFRVVRPDELQGEHWFELEPAEGATVLRHTIEGSASGRYEAIWRARIEPLHDLILEALLDNIEAAIASGDLRVGLPSSRNTIADLTHRSFIRARHKWPVGEPWTSGPVPASAVFAFGDGAG